jgi:large subunit ribosomal protein L25
MEMTAVLKAEIRNMGGVNRLRNHGRIPGVVYGKGLDNERIHVDQQEFHQAIREHGKNSIFQLSLRGTSPLNVMISEIQQHPITNQIIHLDFKQINMKKPITTTVPITIIGQADGVKDGGVIQFQTRELTIRCLPSQIPDHLSLYVSGLKIGDTVMVRDLDIPQGVEVQHEADEVICSIIPPRMQPVEEEPGEEVKEPEIIGARDSHGMDAAK